MPGQNAPQRRNPPAPRKTPAERSAEFDETQRRLKEEAAERRAASAKDASPPGKKPA